MPNFYESGEPIRKGDRVRFRGEPGEIELVADACIADEETDWYVQAYGDGAMVREPKYFGLAFLTETENVDDLVFVARARSADGE
jgi:hypothetical protein